MPDAVGGDCRVLLHHRNDFSNIRVRGSCCQPMRYLSSTRRLGPIIILDPLLYTRSLSRNVYVVAKQSTEINCEGQFAQHREISVAPADRLNNRHYAVLIASTCRV